VGRADFTLRAGDWVEVKSPKEIAETLDAQGTLDGLPFMPEMAQFCGRRFRVTRRAEKTCIEYPGGVYKIREFHNNDVVLLDTFRCSGVDHDGCQRACVLFWKTSWLRKVKQGQQQARVDQSGLEMLRLKIRTTISPGRYFCQSTELDKATRPLSRARVVLKCFSDIWSGSRGIFEMVRMVAVPVWRYYVGRWFPSPDPVGTLKRTPVGDLNLQPGELVRIKSAQEIARTLDSQGRTRGLRCDGGMRQFCGGQYRVRNRLDRMISEATGEMRNVEATVILERLNCLCWWFHVGGCPREDFIYWREVWLERAPGSSTTTAELPLASPVSQRKTLLSATTAPAKPPRG
jgi:hypothetical protein